LLQSVLEFYDKFAEQNTTNPDLQREAARAYCRVGDLHRRLGRDELATAAFRRAAALGEAYLTARPGNDVIRSDLAGFYIRLADMTTKPAELSEAETNLRRAAELTVPPLKGSEEGRRGFGPGPEVLLSRVEIAQAAVLRRAGRSAEGEAALKRAVSRLETGTGHLGSAILLHARRDLAQLLNDRGQKEGARGLLDHCLADLRASAQSDREPGFIGPQFEQLAEGYRDLGDEPTAQQLEDEAESFRGPRHRSPHPEGHGPPPDHDRPPPPPPEVG
jgi:tetratricopeptide (TPR) repeat protein